MLMKNYYILDYTDTFVNKYFKLSNEKLDKWKVMKASGANSISQDGLKFLLKTGLNPTNPYLFIGPPCSSTDIHMDNLIQSYAINYIWGESKSKMSWYDIKANTSIVPKVLTATSGVTTKNINYLPCRDNQVKLIEEVHVTNNILMLVRTDIPHRVTNYSNATRYCLSVRGSPTLKWEDAVEHFKPYFMEESQRIEL